MYDNILNGSYFSPIEPPGFNDDIMDEQDENLYFENLAQRLLEVRKEYHLIWEITKKKCWIKLKLDFLVNQLQKNPSSFNFLSRMNPHVIMNTFILHLKSN
jgi:hypothetical protein